MYLASILFAFTILVGCSNSGSKVPEPEKAYPRFSQISIIESEKEAGSIDVFVKALEEETQIYLIVVAEEAQAPTHEQIKAQIDYNGVSIEEYAQASSVLYKKITGLEEASTYKVYVTLELNDIFAKKMYQTTCHTKTSDEVIDKGSGTQEDPYKVFTIADLELVASDTERLSAYYSLQNDIDLSEKYGEDLLSFVPLSWQTGSLKAFAGTFNGNGHKIKNLYINEKKESVGLFGQLGETGVITNVILENPRVSTTGQRMGAIVGYNKGSVIASSVIGGVIESLVPAGGSAKAGGIVGDMYESGSVIRCVSNTKVIAKGNNVGGIVGSSDASTGKTKALEIKSSYSLSEVQTTGKYAGGIVGYARCVQIESCYAYGDVSGTEGVGGLVGYLQQRNGSSIVPYIKNSFVIGTNIVVTGEEQTNNSGIVLGNRSTANSTDPVIENLYHASSTMTGNQKTPQNNSSEVEVSQFADKTWLKDHVQIDCNNTYWTLKTGAGRPTLVQATWDDGVYTEALVLRNVVVSAPNRNEVKITAESNAGTIAYIVVPTGATAPTAAQIIAQENYGEVSIVGSGISTSNTLDMTVSALADSTSYDVYLVALVGENVTEIQKESITTQAPPVVLETSYEIEDASVGSISITVTSNKAVTTYYKISKVELTLTKDDMLLENSFTSTSVTVDELDENTSYYIYLYSKNAEEDVEIACKTFTTKEDDSEEIPTVPELEVVLVAGEVAYAQAKADFVVAAGSTIHYLITTLEGVYTKTDLIYNTKDLSITFTGLVSETKYYLYAYASKDDTDTTIVCKEITTATWNEFNGTLEKTKVNIYNAQDFYQFVNLANEAERISSTSTSLEVKLFGNIYLEEKVPMITKKLNGTFDGNGFTIYDLVIEEESVSAGLYMEVYGTFKNTVFDGASVLNKQVNAATAGTGIVAGQGRGLFENIIIRNSTVETKNVADSRIGAIVGRLTNQGEKSVSVNNCIVVSTTVIGGKNVGGVVGHVDYQSNASHEISVSNIFAEVTVYGNENVGGVIGQSRATSINLVSKSTILKNESGTDSKNIASIIGYVQNNPQAPLMKPSVQSCVSYVAGKMVGNYSVHKTTAANSDYEKYPTSMLQVAEGEMANQTAVELQDLTAVYLATNTKLSLENGWVLEENQLSLKLGESL